MSDARPRSPDEGETLGAAEAGSKDSVLNSALVPRQYPTADGGSATEFYIDPAKARDAFAGARRRVGLLRAERAAGVNSRPHAVTDLILDAANAVG